MCIVRDREKEETNYFGFVLSYGVLLKDIKNHKTDYISQLMFNRLK